MATSPVKLQQGYGIGNALQNLSPFSIIANRVPTQSDKARIGTFWIYTGANNVYVLSSVTGGLSNWLTLSNGGAGVFMTLTVNGNITQTAGVTSLLATTVNGQLNVSAGLGVIGLFIQTAGNVGIGQDPADQIINIGTGLAIKAVSIGSTTTTSGTSISAGTSGITLNASAVTVTVAGSFRIVPPVLTPADTVVIATANTYSGTIRFNNAATWIALPGALLPAPFVITNSALTANAAVLVTIQTEDGTVANCMLRVAQVRQLVGSMEVYVVNDAAALAASDCIRCIVNFIVMRP